jgi:hypothetical protein
VVEAAECEFNVLDLKVQLELTNIYCTHQVKEGEGSEAGCSEQEVISKGNRG